MTFCAAVVATAPAPVSAAGSSGGHGLRLIAANRTFGCVKSSRLAQQLWQLDDVGGDAAGFGLSSHAAALSLLPSVRRNGHRGSPSVQPPVAHFVLPVRPLRALPHRWPPARRRLLPAQQKPFAMQLRECVSGDDASSALRNHREPVPCRVDGPLELYLA